LRLRSIYMRIYFWLMGERAKIFQNGGSQAVRLPKSCRFADDQEEVMVRRVGRKIILEPADEWPEDFLQCLGAWKEDIPRPASKAIARKKNPFDQS
jgi:antitoxin VapB